MSLWRLSRGHAVQMCWTSGNSKRLICLWLFTALSQSYIQWAVLALLGKGQLLNVVLRKQWHCLTDTLFMCAMPHITDVVLSNSGHLLISPTSSVVGSAIQHNTMWKVHLWALHIFSLLPPLFFPSFFLFFFSLCEICEIFFRISGSVLLYNVHFKKEQRLV